MENDGQGLHERNRCCKVSQSPMLTKANELEQSEVDMQGSSFSPVNFVTVTSVVALFVMGATDVETYS
jgi:hypothetical protein